MRKCVIIGAGASAGYDDNVSDSAAPKITASLLTSGISLGILTETRYKRLYKSLVSSAQIEGKSFDSFISSLDMEKFLKSIHQLAEKESSKMSQSSQSPQSSSDRYDCLAGTLGEIWYFLWDLMRQYSIVVNPTNNNYQRLAASYKKHPFCVITTNYDTILESVILSNGGAFDYGLDSRFLTNTRSIPIAKVHGSINWLNKYSSLIRYEDKLNTNDLLNRVAPTIHNNCMFNDVQNIVNPNEIINYNLSSILRSGEDYDEPVLIPPLGKSKNFEKSRLYQVVWDISETFLNLAKEVVIIGSSIRQEDERFCEAIQKYVQKGTKLIVVDKNEAKIKQRLSDLFDWIEIDKVDYYPSFTKYADSL